MVWMSQPPAVVPTLPKVKNSVAAPGGTGLSGRPAARTRATTVTVAGSGAVSTLAERNDSARTLLQLRPRPDALCGEQTRRLPQAPGVHEVAEELDGAYRFEPCLPVEVPGCRGSGLLRACVRRCRHTGQDRGACLGRRGRRGRTGGVAPRSGDRGEEAAERCGEDDEEDDEAAADHGPMLAACPREPQG